MQNKDCFNHYEVGVLKLHLHSGETIVIFDSCYYNFISHTDK